MNQGQRLVNNGSLAVIWRKERHREERTYWIAEWFLLEKCKGLNSNYLRQKARWAYRESVKPSQREKEMLPDTGISWRYFREQGTFYYDYTRIPDALPTQYRSKLGTIEDVKRLSKVVQVDEDRTFFRIQLASSLTVEWKAYLHSFTHYGDTHQEQLSRACAAVEAIRVTVAERNVDLKKQEFWRMVSEELEQNGTVCYLPMNHRRLQQKVVATLDKPIVQVIDLPRVGNKNAEKDFDGEIMSWVMQLRVMGQNYTNTWIIKKVTAMCALIGYECPSESWFSRELAKEKVKILTGTARFGEDSRNAHRYRAYVPLKNALFAGDCWQVDATRINILPFMKKVEVDGKTKRREEFVILVAVRDVHSGDLVAVHIDTKEDCDGYINVMRQAVRNTGHLPYEVVFDRFPGHNTDKWELVKTNMERCGTKVTVTHKANGKAKLERFWSTFQTVFMQDSDKYYGEGILSRSIFARKSSEYLKSTRKAALASGWDFEKAWDEVVGMVECYRTRKLSDYKRNCKIHLSPSELYAQSDKLNVVTVLPFQMAQCFWQFKDATINGGMVKTTILNVDYFYAIAVEDYTILKEGRKVTLGYDYDDLSKVFVFERNNIQHFLCEAQEQSRVLVTGPDANWEEYGKADARNNAIKKKLKEDLDKAMESVHDVNLILGALGNKAAVNASEDAWVKSSLNPSQGGTSNVEENVEEEDEFEKVEFSIVGQM